MVGEPLQQRYQAFRRDLGAAAIFFMRQGRLFLDLKYDTGTMEFGR